jgi:hypothetical protein
LIGLGSLDHKPANKELHWQFHHFRRCYILLATELEELLNTIGDVDKLIEVAGPVCSVYNLRIFIVNDVGAIIVHEN